MVDGWQDNGPGNEQKTDTKTVLSLVKTFASKTLEIYGDTSGSQGQTRPHSTVVRGGSSAARGKRGVFPEQVFDTPIICSDFTLFIGFCISFLPISGLWRGVVLELNLGIRAHDIEKDSLEELTKEIARKGLSAVQLALAKSFKDKNTAPGSFSPGYAKHIRDAFQKENLEIAVLGCYIHMIHPDKKIRRKELERFKEHIRYARDFGCSIVGTETGNVSAKMGYNEDNFKEKPFLEVVDSVKELVEEAEKFGVIVGIEGGINHPVHSPQVMKRLLDSIDSNNLQVIFDPANFMDMDNYQRQEEVFEEAMELFGDRIVIVHAKDFIIENNWIKMVPVGTGMLNYDAIFKLLKQRKPHIHVLLENTREPYIDQSIKFLRKKYAEA